MRQENVLYTQLNAIDGDIYGWVNLTAEQRAERIAKERKLEGLRYQISKYDLQQYNNNKASYFYFLIYNQLMNDFPKSTGMIFRFMYLCTYGDYTNTIVINNTPLNLSDVRDLLMLSNKRGAESIREMIKHNLLITTDNGVKINEKYYLRGKLNDIKQGVTRIYNKGLQELYKKSTYRDHKLLSHFVPLLPYVNKYYNIICVNPEEKEIKYLVPLSFKDVASLFGVDLSNANRLKKKLLSIKVNDKSLIGHFTREFDDGLLSYYAVNPYVYCKAPTEEYFRFIAKNFDIKRL
jgi:hypothetical protein